METGFFLRPLTPNPNPLSDLATFLNFTTDGEGGERCVLTQKCQLYEVITSETTLGMTLT